LYSSSLYPSIIELAARDAAARDTPAAAPNLHRFEGRGIFAAQGS